MAMDGENRIVLNVGGIRFETYKTVFFKIFSFLPKLLLINQSYM